VSFTLTIGFFNALVVCLLVALKQQVTKDYPNAYVQRDLQVTTVKHEARKCSVNYRKRLAVHPNSLATTLLLEQPVARRLKRLYPGDRAINT
jgi:uncharacterized lipoprotein YbaY